MNKTQGEPSLPPCVLPAAGKTNVGRSIKREAKFAFNLALLIGLMLPLWAQDYSRVVGPIAHVYATTDGVELKLVIHERVGNGLTFRFRRLGRRSGRQGVRL